MTQNQSISTGQMNPKWPGDTCLEKPQEFHAASFEHWYKDQASLAPLLRVQCAVGLASHTIHVYT